MKVYKPLTLGRLIDRLDELGDTPVEGLNGQVHSYRGYYERNATLPCRDTHPASVLAKKYRSAIGHPMTGWKGGDFTVSPDELIYYADYGDANGHAIAGLEQADDGTYVLVGVDEHVFLYC